MLIIDNVSAGLHALAIEDCVGVDYRDNGDRNLSTNRRHLPVLCLTRPREYDDEEIAYKED